MKNQYTKTDFTNVLNKALRGKTIPTELRNALTTSDDGALLLPEDLKSDIAEKKKYNKSMSQVVHVIPVDERFGRYSTEDEGNYGELIAFDTDNPISEADLKLKGVSWSLINYGSFTPLSEDLYKDSAFDLMEFFKNAHGEKAAKTENKLIVNAIRSSLPVKNLASVPDLKTSLNMDLNPSLENEITIATNQDGMDILNKLDANGNPIKYFESIGPKRFFDIYRFEVYSNEDFPSLNGQAPFVYGSFKRAVKFFTSNRVDVLLVKNPFGLHVPVHIMRGIEEFDVKVIPGTTQLIYGEIPIVVG